MGTIFIGFLVIIGLMRITYDPLRQNLFDNFTKNYRSTAEFSLMFSLFNFYIFTLAYVYLPLKSSKVDIVGFKEQTMMTMLNNLSEDDEEDVLYG